MGGRLATGLMRLTDDPSDIDGENFWAISTTFEGRWCAAEFREVVNCDWDSAREFTPVTNPWNSNMSRSQYIEYVQNIRAEIAQGWVYQVNACREITAQVDDGYSLEPLFTEILKRNPAPYASYLRIPGLEIASASPELFLKRVNNVITSSPIKGTKKNGDPEFGAKDRAENIMIVDLIRNDLGQICQPGTVDVPRLLSNEVHPGIDHLVSDVSGTLKVGLTWAQILTPLLPPGSVSGAPKSSALKSISRYEGTSRGPYCGALGWVQGSDALLAVAIRTFWKDSNEIKFGTGAGITWDSNAELEWEETELKARRLISIAQGVLR